MRSVCCAPVVPSHPRSHLSWRWHQSYWRLAVPFSACCSGWHCSTSAADSRWPARSTRFAPGFDWGAFARSAGIAFVAGLVLTFLAAFLPTFGALRSEITQERRTTRRIEAAPFWKRAYLDGFALLAAVIVLVVTQLNGGFKPTGNEGRLSRFRSTFSWRPSSPGLD